MRVLYFSDNGSDHNRRFLDKIASFGHDVWFLNFTSDEPPPFSLSSRVQWIRPRRTVPRNVAPKTAESFVEEFRFWLARVNPDIVHAGPVPLCGYVAALAKAHPLLVTSWGSDLLSLADQNHEWISATRLALQGADGFLCDCNTVRDAALRFAAIPDSRIAQFPWGLECPVISDKPHARETGKGHATFICTRSWEPNYDIDVLLDAFGLLHEKNNLSKLILVGGGSLRSQVERIIIAKTLEKAVITPGVVPASEMTKWFESADVYVSCARSDGTSISMLEAMAAGLPVILTDIPSNREWVVQGENGWLATQGAAQDFADKMLHAAGLSPGQRDAIALRNRKIVATRADWDKNFPALMDLYQKLSGAPRLA